MSSCLCGKGRSDFVTHSNDFNNNSIGNNVFARGIELSGSEGINNDISDNNFLPPSTLTSFLPAFRIESFKKAKFCSNTIVNANRAFEFAGLNDETDFVSNTAHGCLLVKVENNSWIDEQFHKGNRWFPLSGNVSGTASQAECVNPLLVDFSLFEVHTPQTIAFDPPFPPYFYVYHPRDITPDVDDEWWSQTSGSPEEGCLSQIANNPSEIKKAIADGSLLNTIGNPSLVWQAEQFLYSRLKGDEDLLNSYPPFQTFLTAKEGENIALLYDVNATIKEAWVADSFYYESVLGYVAVKDSIITALEDVDEILNTSSNTQELETATLNKEVLLNQMAELDYELTELNITYYSEVVQKLIQAKQQNDVIILTSILESNEKTFNDIYIKRLTAQNGILTQGQIDSLDLIAVQCPINGGMAVYYARGILPHCYQNLYTDDYEGCYPIADTTELEQATERSNKLLNNNWEDVKVFPNPAIETISFHIPKGQSGVLELYNNTSQIVKRQNIIEENEINISQIPSGVYVYSVSLSNGQFYQDKIVILSE